MDMVELLPMSMKTLDMVPDNVGERAFHCHVNDHITAGMAAKFTVLASGSDSRAQALPSGAGDEAPGAPSH